MSERDFMRRAIALSFEGANSGGGPFGAVVVKDGVIVGSGKNQVVPRRDPTAHAEILAIRDACEKLGTHDLGGCEMYASCEPCPMCLAAVWWARIEKLYYANSRADAKAIGFDDDYFYDQMALPENRRAVPVVRLLEDEAKAAFTAWAEKADKTPY